MAWTFGDFTPFCRYAAMPVCRLLSPPPTRICELVGFTSGNVVVRNLGDTIMAFLAIVLSIGFMIKTFRKHAAVGRKEMNVFLSFYILLLAFQIVTVGGYLENVAGPYLSYLSAIHVGITSAVFYLLLVNAFVGYQWLDDGSAMSMTITVLGALVIGAGTALIAVDTGLGTPFSFFSKNGTNSIALIVLYGLWPALCVLTYLISQTHLVLKHLGEKKPLAYLYGSFLIFILGLAIMFFLNPMICQSTSQFTDGALFSTLCILLAIIGIFKYWDSITADDWEDQAYDGGDEF